MLSIFVKSFVFFASSCPIYFFLIRPRLLYQYFYRHPLEKQTTTTTAAAARVIVKNREDRSNEKRKKQRIEKYVKLIKIRNHFNSLMLFQLSR